MNQLGFTENDLRNKFTYNQFREFDKFMYGQTVATIEGETTYYFSDVQNFCNQYNVEYPQIEPIESHWGCPLCHKQIVGEKEYWQHIVQEHEEFVKQFITFANRCDDLGYANSMFKCELDNLESKRYWNL